MNRIKIFNIIFIFLSSFFLVAGIQEVISPVYVGPKKCKLCHGKEYIGNQYDIWINGPHAKAYQTLLSEKSIDIARKLGIKEPEKSAKCLQCHVTAYNDPANMKNDLSLEDGISCEACHGPGSEYRTITKMRKISTGELDKSEVGMIEADEKLCKTCHNKNSPTYKTFNFNIALKIIHHPVPAQEIQN